MADMKVLVFIALSLVAAIAQAQAGQSTPEPAAKQAPIGGATNAPSGQSVKPLEKAESPRDSTASVAISLAEDGDTLVLPPFASRTTPAPTRVLRVGVEWRF